MKLNKSVLAIALATAALGFSGMTSAHTYAGTISGTTVGSHDLIQTTCFSWANGVHPAAVAPEVNGAAQRFVASLAGTGSSAITIQALPNGAVVNNGLNSLSQATQYAAGTYTIPNNGVYFVKINRVTAGAAVGYTATFHCANTATGGINAPHTGTGENFAGDVGNSSPSVDYKVMINQ